MKIKSIDEYINLCNEGNVTPTFKNFSPALNESAEVNAVTEEVFDAYTKYKSNNIVSLNEYASIKTFEEFVMELDDEDEEVAATEPSADADEVTGDTDELEGDDVDSGEDAGDVGDEETAPEEAEPEAGEEEEAEVEEAPEGEADDAEEVEAEETEEGEPEDKGEEASDELEDTADNEEEEEPEIEEVHEPGHDDEEEVEEDEEEEIEESAKLTNKQKSLPEGLKRAILKKAGMNEEEIEAELAKMNEESDPVDKVNQDVKKANAKDPASSSDDVEKEPENEAVTAPGKSPADAGSAGHEASEIDGKKAKKIEDEKVKEGEPKKTSDDEKLQGNGITNEGVKKKS